MTSKFSFFVAALAMVFSVGCAKTPEQKAQETKSSADSALSDLKTVAGELDGMGTPLANWSDEKLTKYENTLNALELHIQRVESFDGKDGVYIIGKFSLHDLRKIISNNRRILDDARMKKARAAQFEVQQKQEAEERATAKAQVDALRENLSEAVKKIDEDGVPLQSWTTERLKNHATLTAQADALILDYEAKSGIAASSGPGKNALLEMKDNLKKRNVIIDMILKSRPTSADQGRPAVL